MTRSILVDRLPDKHAQAMDYAPEVHANHPVPVLLRRRPGITPAAHTGVVEQQMYAAKIFQRFFKNVPQLGLDCDVGGNRQHRVVSGRL